MKLRALIVTVILAVLFLSAGILYAANGDLIVNGNLGVGTSTPASKAEVNGNLKVDGTVTSNGETVNGNATMTSATISGSAIISTATISSATVTGNATVNGNLGVGTSTPTQKLDVNGNVKGTGLCIGSNCTSTLHVSGGLYGHCEAVYSSGLGCKNILSPAICIAVPIPVGGTACGCPNGYSLVGPQYGPWVCYKN